MAAAMTNERADEIRKNMYWAARRKGLGHLQAQDRAQSEFLKFWQRNFRRARRKSTGPRV